MKKIFLATVTLLLLVNVAKADGDWFWNDGVAQYNIHNDHRRVIQKRTVVKKYYNNTTIVKEVPVPVPVPTALPPVAVVPQTMQVGRLPTATVPIVASTVPVAPAYVPVCRMVKTEAVIDQFGNVLDYIYTRVCG